ncbi:putative queuosine salvage protein [Monocercomonoides exilis]|uniref:putative queuosine salvage protein n=1 Tax=Monocercomonoides exilis TaxID=2049356 RepID=UPI00355A2A57|nr:putative queuosine salvage protein [Monocercomonoides exilis]|eukprot:MONOS_1234.1-p1 / transcript=MONOS_1234.1 / gene=MONOS_1234 / organism=Monocercomonoides_exilis_PA203 / gene_product=UPF0553 protein C9orf64-like protein / transcript_product=UPF0553 protein C9orf64-like protein / location=Mono_scaffold00021:67827-69281(-) / protein_length=433 / sequence_SO=supercontig / SO=protein_coding / is_pseudo=false
MENPVKLSSALIASTSRHVFISEEKCNQSAEWLLEEIKKGNFSQHNEPTDSYIPKIEEIGEEMLAQWIFFLDVLNFSFYYDDGSSYCIEFPEGSKTIIQGYWAHVISMHRARMEHIPFLTAKWMSECTEKDVSLFYRYNNSHPEKTCPLVEKRVEVLHEAGKWLTAECDGLFANFIRKCNHSAVQISVRIADALSSFRDRGIWNDGSLDSLPKNSNLLKEQIYKHKLAEKLLDEDWKEPISSTSEIKIPVAFHKRAQIIAADLWVYFNRESLGSFNDIDELTMFADYRVPQVLAHLGALQYSDQLLELLRSGEKKKDDKQEQDGLSSSSSSPQPSTSSESCISSTSQESLGQSTTTVMIAQSSRVEMEIRGCSIFALSLITQKIKELIASTSLTLPDDVIVNDVTVDNYLWLWGKQHLKILSVPAHNTRTCFY